MGISSTSVRAERHNPEPVTRPDMKKTNKLQKDLRKLHLSETTVRPLTQTQIVIGGVLQIGHCTNFGSGCSIGI